MSVFMANDAPPGWCELEGFAIVSAQRGDHTSLEFQPGRNRVIVVLGYVQIAAGDRSEVVGPGQYFDIDVGRATKGSLQIMSTALTLVHAYGHWGQELGGCGIFRVAIAENPADGGDPVSYRKGTSFDSHYHDCDEYWIVTDGVGEVVVGGEHYRVEPGDCVATPMGQHHDFPLVETPVTAIYFETTLRGRKRLGHLWNHQHGKPDIA